MLKKLIIIIIFLFSFQFINNIVDVVDNNTFASIGSNNTCHNNLPISTAKASNHQKGNIAKNTLDGDLKTLWSYNKKGSWIRADLGTSKNICDINIAWNKGNERQNHFVIATSTDGSKFNNVLSSTSSGTTLNSENYTVPNMNARYVRITVNGNTKDNWAAITELDIFGSISNSPPVANGSISNSPPVANGSISNSPPVANDLVITTNKNIAKAITLKATDSNNDSLTYSIVTKPSHGTVTGTGPVLNYYPNIEYTGPDIFAYKVNDGTVDSNIAKVNITVIKVDGSPNQTGFNSADIVAITIVFAIIVAFAMLIPLLYDLHLAYSKKHVNQEGKLIGLEGLGRTTMVVGVVVLVGLALFYLIGSFSLGIQNHPDNDLSQSMIDVIKNITTVLGGAISAIIGFYFGNKATVSGIEKGKESGEVTEGEEGLTVNPTFPSDGSTQIALNVKIKAVFNRPIDDSTIANNFKVNSGAAPINGNVTLEHDIIAIFEPQPALLNSTEYTCTITKGVKDKQGNALQDEKSWSFKTI
jgi:hypothetical protein